MRTKQVDLKQRYTDEIKSWNWENIKHRAMNNLVIREEEDGVEGFDYLGSVLQMYPSGKFYMPWTTNQTNFDVIKDQLYRECLEQIAEEHGLYVTGDDDLGVLAGVWFDWTELGDLLEHNKVSFFDNESEEKAKAIMKEM